MLQSTNSSESIGNIEDVGATLDAGEASMVKFTTPSNLRHHSSAPSPVAISSTPKSAQRSMLTPTTAGIEWEMLAACEATEPTSTAVSRPARAPAQLPIADFEALSMIETPTPVCPLAMIGSNREPGSSSSAEEAVAVS